MASIKRIPRGKGVRTNKRPSATAKALVDIAVKRIEARAPRGPSAAGLRVVKKTKPALTLVPPIKPFTPFEKELIDRSVRAMETAIETEKEPAPIRLRLIEPTASKTDLYLACPWPWGRTAPAEEVGQGARFGSAFHEMMADWFSNGTPPFDGAYSNVGHKYDVAPADLKGRVEAAYPIVETWLRGDNQWGIVWKKAPIFIVEHSMAYDPTTDEARIIHGPTEKDHRYADRQPNEIPGTADVIACVTVKGEKTVLVLDHKSGWRVSADWQPHTPAESGQLRTLALALCRILDANRAIVAYFHAPPNTPPVVHADVLDKGDLEIHRRTLMEAGRLTNSGFMRPGPHCADCPTFMQCPTQTTSLAELKKVGGLMTPERVGAIHQAAAEYDNLRDRLRGEMRAWVKAHGAAIRPDGQYVDIVSKEVTGLSQASIIRALGKLKGQAMIENLRKLGAVETSTREELRAVRR